MQTTLLTAALIATLALGGAKANTGIALSGNARCNAISGNTVFLKISGSEPPIKYSSHGTMKGSMGTVVAALAHGDLQLDFAGDLHSELVAEFGGRRGERSTVAMVSSGK